MAGPDANFFSMVTRQYEQKAARKERQRDRTIQTIQGAAQMGMQAYKGQQELDMRKEEFEAKKGEREALDALPDVMMDTDLDPKTDKVAVKARYAPQVAQTLNSIVKTDLQLKQLRRMEDRSTFLRSIMNKSDSAGELDDRPYEVEVPSSFDTEGLLDSVMGLLRREKLQNEIPGASTRTGGF